MKRVLITGGAGYKGVLLTTKLLERGFKVTILDNFMYGYDSILHLVNHPNLKVFQKDVRSLNRRDVGKYDLVFHLAGISGYPACEANPHSAKIINVDASRRLGKCLSKAQVLIYASTTSFYGSAGTVCDETSKIHPTSLYGITKYQAEHILMQRPNTIALRFATLFGVSPRMRVDLLVNDFVYRAIAERCLVLFESRTKRTFLHVQDAIDGYLFAVEHLGQMVGQIFNIGANTLNFSKLEVAQAVQAQTKCKIIDSDMEDFDTRNFVISFEKIAKRGYTPHYTLEAGVKELVKVYRFYRPFPSFKTI